MLTEIDKDFYCSCDFMQMGNYEPEHCHGKTQGYCDGCSARHRKHPTPEQFKEEYGFDYPDKGAVYCCDPTGKLNSDKWFIFNYKWFKENKQRYTNDGQDLLCICACTPFGIPPENWKPE